MNEIDILKMVVAIVASYTAYIFINATEPNRTEDELAEDEVIRVFVLLIRAIIIVYSVNYKWPLAMCVGISVFITVTVIAMRNPDDEEKNKSLT